MTDLHNYHQHSQKFATLINICNIAILCQSKRAFCQ